MEEDFLQKNDLEFEQASQKKKADEEFLHKIDLDALKKETGLSLDEIALLSGIKESRNLGKWAQGKDKSGSRPNYNAIVRLLQKGATQYTLFGVEPKPSVPENPVKREPFNYKDPEFLESVQNAMAYIEECKKRGIK